MDEKHWKKPVGSRANSVLGYLLNIPFFLHPVEEMMPLISLLLRCFSHSQSQFPILYINWIITSK